MWVNRPTGLHVFVLLLLIYEIFLCNGEKTTVISCNPLCPLPALCKTLSMLVFSKFICNCHVWLILGIIQSTSKVVAKNVNYLRLYRIFSICFPFNVFNFLSEVQSFFFQVHSQVEKGILSMQTRFVGKRLSRVVISGV